METKHRVMVVDDHAIVREGLKSLIDIDGDFEVVHAASSGLECLAAVDRYRPDIILMDLKMPGIDGVEATRLIKSEYPGIKVVFLTNYDDEAYVLEAIKSGADGYVLKDVKKGDLLNILHEVIENRAFIDPGVTRKVFHQLQETSGPDMPPLSRPELSQRELEILALLAEGRSNREIAEALHISPDTVKSHLKNIYQKLGARNRSHASRIAIKRHLVHL